MGQKTNPIGLRVGIYHKWTSSWYDNNKAYTNKKLSYVNNGIISSRGGAYFTGLESFALLLFKRYSRTKVTKSPFIIPFDFRLFKGSGGQSYGFLRYTKFVRQRLINIVFKLMVNQLNNFFKLQKQFIEPKKREINGRQAIVIRFTTGRALDQNTNLFFVYLFIEKWTQKKALSIINLYDILITQSNFYYFDVGIITRKNKLDFLISYFTIQRVFNSIWVNLRKNKPSIFISYGRLFCQNKEAKRVYITKNNQYSFKRKYINFYQTNFFDKLNIGNSQLFSKIFIVNNTYNFVRQRNANSQKLLSKKVRRNSSWQLDGVNNKASDFITKQKQGNNLNVPINSILFKKQINTIFGVNCITLSFFYKRRFSKKKVQQKTNTYYTKAFNIKSITPQTLKFKLIRPNSNELNQNIKKSEQLKSLFSFIIGAPFSLYQVNARSLTRFVFDQQAKVIAKRRGSQVKQSKNYISLLENRLRSRFRYVGVYIKDLIRVTYLSIFFKKASFRAAFYAFTIGKLPRNRKELKYVHFLISLFKIFTVQNKEIIGVRIRFQGRLNRWRRTKHILGSKGTIGYFSYINRIDYGRAQAITRKGALGIHIWICYQQTFRNKLRQSILEYRSLTNLVNYNK